MDACTILLLSGLYFNSTPVFFLVSKKLLMKLTVGSISFKGPSIGCIPYRDFQWPKVFLPLAPLASRQKGKLKERERDRPSEVCFGQRERKVRKESIFVNSVYKYIYIYI